jgi:hypothetical protein
MNQAMHVLSLAAFLTLPPIFLGVRLARHDKMPWWMFLLLTAGVSWVLVNSAVHFHYAHLTQVLQSYGESPPADLLERWANDGAKKVFALLLGWLYGVVYLGPWLVVYYFLTSLRRHITR